jgi:hypothetical protein
LIGFLYFICAMKITLSEGFKKSMYLRRRGYMLFESLIALAILISVVVPLTTLFYRKSNSVRLQQSITSMCLMEQEAALSIAFPQGAVPTKRRALDGKEWTVKTETSGADPVVYKIIASMNGRVIDSVVFYGRKADAAAK